MSESLHRRLPIAAILSCAVAAALVGCSNRAHSDLYQQRMASEIRVLEDQLYDADYRNRVLHDELERCKIQATEIPIHQVTPKKPPPVEARPEADSRSRRREDSPRADSQSVDQDDMGSGLESADDLGDMEDLELPKFDEGEPVDPEALTDPEIPSLPKLPGEADAGADDASMKLLPAPGGPEPPGKEDLRVPPVLPGEVLPPPSAEGDEVMPPGQIQLPDSVQSVEGIPDRLRVHPALSGGRRVDGKVERIMVVINVLDKLGNTIDLDRFDVQAALSIVILDPLREPSEARLGRWDFSSQEVTSLVRSDPISGIHVPIQWEDSEPTGEEVIVHVRLRSEEDEMRCEARMKVEQQTVMAEWTPRGESIR